MNTQIEKRSITSAELRALEGDDELVIAGYAASFNVLSANLGGFREKISPGAFKDSLAAGADVRCLFNHDSNIILGRTKSGTLDVCEDSRGLKIRCQLDENQQSHRDLHSSIKRGDISQMSFAFSIPDGGDDWLPTDPELASKTGVYSLRTLKRVNLHDVSPVAFPAYDAPGATTIAARFAAGAGATGDELRRKRCADIAKQIESDRDKRIAEALRECNADAIWLERLAEIPSN